MDLQENAKLSRNTIRLSRYVYTDVLLACTVFRALACLLYLQTGGTFFITDFIKQNYQKSIKERLSHHV